MRHRKYILLLILATVTGVVSFLLVLYKLEPCTLPGEQTICEITAAASLLLFYLSAFVTLAGFFALLGLILRFWLAGNEVRFDEFSISLRQSLLLTFCTIGAMTLLLLKALTWWSGLLLILLIVLIELYFTRSA